MFRLTPVKFQTAVGVVRSVVILLSVIQWSFHFAALFYLLLPGNMVSLLLTGGHSGTVTQDAIAPFATAIANIVVYASLLFGCAWLRDRLGRN